MTVSQLGLSQPETRRLKAVAGSRYRLKNDELMLVSRKYRELHRNKADLRNPSASSSRTRRPTRSKGGK